MYISECSESRSFEKTSKEIWCSGIWHTKREIKRVCNVVGGCGSSRFLFFFPWSPKPEFFKVHSQVLSLATICWNLGRHHNGPLPPKTAICRGPWMHTKNRRLTISTSPRLWNHHGHLYFPHLILPRTQHTTPFNNALVLRLFFAQFANNPF